MTTSRQDQIDNLTERWNTLTDTMAILTDQFTTQFSLLSKKQMERVALIVIEYPVQSDKVPFSENEAGIANTGVKLKETQMAMAIINGALQELKQQEKSNG